MSKFQSPKPKTTHLATYWGSHPDMIAGALYECEMQSTFFYVLDENGVGLLLPQDSFDIHQAVDHKGSPIVNVGTVGHVDYGKDPYAGNAAPVDYATLEACNKHKEAGREKQYRHSNALEKTSRLQKDKESTRDLRQYRYTPDEEY